MNYCRYRNAHGHICTTKFGQPIHGDQTCHYEANAQIRNMEDRGVNTRTLTIDGTLETGDPCRIVLHVPASFANVWKNAQ